MDKTVVSDTEGQGFESYKKNLKKWFLGFKNKSLRETFPSLCFETLLYLYKKALKSLVEFIQVQLFY